MPKKFLLQHRIGGFWLVAEEHVGTAPDTVLVSLRENAKDRRKPGPRMTFESAVGRARLFGLAYDLIDLAQAMLPETTMDTSAVIARGGALPTPRNKRFVDGVREHQGERLRVCEEGVMAAFARIQDRMPVLQRAQRVLEACDQHTADWLENALIVIQRTGEPPLLAADPPPLPEVPTIEPTPAKSGLFARLASLTRGKRPASADPEPIPF